MREDGNCSIGKRSENSFYLNGIIVIVIVMMVLVINPQRACAARVTVVVLCMCVYSLKSAASHNGITKARYQRIHRNTGTIKKRGNLAKNASFRSYAVISFTSTYTQYKYTYNTQLVHVGCACTLTHI